MRSLYLQTARINRERRHFSHKRYAINFAITFVHKGELNSYTHARARTHTHTQIKKSFIARKGHVVLHLIEQLYIMCVRASLSRYVCVREREERERGERGERERETERERERERERQRDRETEGQRERERECTDIQIMRG